MRVETTHFEFCAGVCVYCPVIQQDNMPEHILDIWFRHGRQYLCHAILFMRMHKRLRSALDTCYNE